MTELLGKDFKIELGYIPRKDFDNGEFKFTPVGPNKKYERIQEANKLLEENGFNSIFIAATKPNSGEGLWVSPCKGDYSTWGEMSAYIGLDEDFADTYYKVVPDPDCRILLIDSTVVYSQFESKYDFRWELIAKDYDLVFVKTHEVIDSIHTFMGMVDPKPKYTMMLNEWECISGVFLNKKFTLGERVKYNPSINNPDANLA